MTTMASSRADRSSDPIAPDRAADRPGGRGLLIVLSSPSGAGKTTLAHRLLDEFEATEFSISFTTRAPRKNERDGLDYHFVTGARFQRMIDDDEFAEWAEVHGNRYGTDKTTVERALAGGRDVIFDIDWQGGRSLSQKWPEDALMVFIAPPGLDILAARLRGRGTDAEDVIKRRLAKAVDEMRHHGEYLHVIVNDDLDRAYGLLRAIYLTTRYRGQVATLTGALAETVAEAERALSTYDEAAARELVEAMLVE